MSQKVVNIPYRECKIMYDVDLQSVAKMAEHFGIEWVDMKAALRSYGFVIRKGEEKPESPAKPYSIVLTDKDKIVAPATAVTVASVS